MAENENFGRTCRRYLENRKIQLGSRGKKMLQCLTPDKPGKNGAPKYKGAPDRDQRRKAQSWGKGCDAGLP